MQAQQREETPLVWLSPQPPCSWGISGPRQDSDLPKMTLPLRDPLGCPLEAQVLMVLVTEERLQRGAGPRDPAKT